MLGSGGKMRLGGTMNRVGEMAGVGYDCQGLRCSTFDMFCEGARHCCGQVILQPCKMDCVKLQILESIFSHAKLVRNIEFYKLKNFTGKFDIYCDIFIYVKLSHFALHISRCNTLNFGLWKT